MKPDALDPRLEERLREAESRFAEVDAGLASPEVLSNPDSLKKLGQARSDLEPIVEAGRELRSLLEERSGARELAESDDEEMAALAEGEIESLDERIGKLQDRVKELLIPPDPLADRAAVLEIRAGTGGDEAALFAADLYRMYQRLCETRGWKIEVMNSNPTEIGGYKEIVYSVSGKGVFGELKYESGVHRVQRVPETESGGRIHTSAVTVAVLPEAEESDVQVNQEDLRIDVYRSSGPGGQSVNTTDSAVRITHIPTGLVVICQDEKSQLKNKAKALRVLKARLYEMEENRRQQEEAAARRSQIGSGDRSERIRTYNFPQNRFTDHRINLTLYRLDAIMQGELDEAIETLKITDREAYLKEHV